MPPAEAQQVLDHLTAALAVLQPYLIALTPEQRKTLPKMSDGNLPFVQDCLQFSVSNAQFAPPFLDVSELKKDVEVVQVLNPMDNLAVTLASLLNDTMMLAGSEAYVAALAYYNSVKLANKMNIPGAKVIYETLKKRFEGQGNFATKPPTT